jgi:predicted transposase/invertase (TIGR01784 family)
MYDNVCKFLVESFSQDFAQWLLGEAIGLTQLSPSELSVSPIRADALILLASDQGVLHLEFQTQPDPDIPFRMADYRLRVYRRYPNKPMRQVVIYLKPSRSDLVQQRVFTLPGTRHEFQVIRLWEVPTADLWQYPGLLPLAILSCTEDKTQTLRAIAQRIESLPERGEQSNVAAATSILAGLVLEKAVIRQILREEIMRDSVIYQDILEQGLQKGVQQGIQQGRQEGRQQGEADLVLRLLQCRIGLIDHELEVRIRSLSVEQLEALGEALLDFTQPDELLIWLANNQKS